MKLTVIGMGTRAEDCTLAAYEAIQNAELVLVKTEKNHIAAFLKERGIAYGTLDSVYEKSRNFDSLNKNLASAALTAAKTANTCYLVDGALAEDRSVKILLNKRKPITFIDGVSKLSQVLQCTGDLTYTAVSAYDVEENARFTLPLAVYDVDTAFTASEVKLHLSNLFGEETPVYFCVDGSVKQMLLYEIDRVKSYGTGATLYLPKAEFLSKQRYDFYDLVEIIRMLRLPNGCPWDREQTHESIRQNMIEEAYELVNAIDSGDADNLEEESGDVLMQSAFHAVMAKEEGSFDIDDVTTRVCKKLIFRHSHVFGTEKTTSAEEALAIWNRNKKVEKSQKLASETLLDLPTCLPQLLRAEKTKSRAAKVNFDWKTFADVMAKLKEETAEVEEAVQENNPDRIREECGDFLLAAACVVSHLGLHPEMVLKEGTDKFVRRFTNMEKRILADGKKMGELTDEEYDAYWTLSKKD